MSNVADGANILLGKGKLYFERFTAAGAVATGGYRFLGNVLGFGLTMSDETKEVYSSAEAGAPLLKQALIRRTVELAVTMDEVTADNVALGLMGTDHAAAAQTAATITDQIVYTNLPADGSMLDRAYPVALAGVRQHHWNSATPVTVKIASTTLTVATDYSFDYVAGVLYLANNATTLAACAGGTGELTISGVLTAYLVGAYRNVYGAVVGVVEGAFMFVADPSAGPKCNVFVWRADCTPDGEWGLIGDDFGEFKLKAKVIADSVAHPTNPLFLVEKVS